MNYEDSEAAEEFRNSGYGEESIRTWFAAPNKFLEGATPEVALSDDPDGVTAAAKLFIAGHR
jgi:hypothetical protein